MIWVIGIIILIHCPEHAIPGIVIEFIQFHVKVYDLI